MKKNDQLLVKLDKDLKREFLKICERKDTSGSREVRHFIRDFVEKNKK